MKKVNLFIAGEPKSGTSALNEFLSQHPDIYMSYEKEPCFFCSDIQEESIRHYGKNVFFHHTDLESYSSLFKEARHETVLGEASTLYLYSKASAKEIYGYNPEAKIIMMFREPVSFMYSLHSQYVSETTENEPDFGRALDLEPERKKHQQIPAGARSPSFLFYRERTRYLDHIKRFVNTFDKSRLCVIIFEDFLKDNDKVFKNVLNFLGVDPCFRPAYRIVNENKVIKYKFLNRLVQAPGFKRFFWKAVPSKMYYQMKKGAERMFYKQEKRPPLDELLKNKLRKEFIEDIKRLNDYLREEDLINLDLLSLWEY